VETQAPVNQPVQPVQEFKPIAVQQSINFKQRSTERLKTTGYLNSGNICWLVGLILFAAAIILPLGILPAQKMNVGFLRAMAGRISDIVSNSLYSNNCRYGTECYKFSNPRRILKQIFRLASTTAGFVFLVLLLLTGKFIHTSLFASLLILYVIALFVIRKSDRFLKQFQTFAAAAFLAGVYTMIVSLFLKSEMLANTGAGLSANRGYYAHLAALIFVLAGCLTKKETSFNAEN